jgi:mercuric ion transport protein
MSKAKLISTGIIAAFASSICCITPLLALFAGSGSFASSFSWVAPARPYMILLTVIVLGFAWYLQLRPKATDDCDCAIDQSPKFFQSKTFLSGITLFAVLMMEFPFLVKEILPVNGKTSQAVVDMSKSKTIELSIDGMNCEACELHINNELAKLKGVYLYHTSYPLAKSVVTYDPTKVTTDSIVAAINLTGYKVKNSILK